MELWGKPMSLPCLSLKESTDGVLATFFVAFSAKVDESEGEFEGNAGLDLRPQGAAGARHGRPCRQYITQRIGAARNGIVRRSMAYARISATVPVTARPVTCPVGTDAGGALIVCEIACASEAIVRGGMIEPNIRR